MARPRDTELRMLRYLPGDTPVHRMWAGTKILCVAAASLALSLRPTWRALGIVGALVIVALVAAIGAAALSLVAIRRLRRRLA